MSFSSLKKKYFDGPIPSGFVSLYTGKTIVMISTGLLGLFLPIFLYNLFDGSLRMVVLYSAVASLFYAVTVAWGAQFLNKFGFRRALRISVFFGALYYATFYLVNHANAIYLIPLSIIILTAFRLLYWLPYHVDFAKFSSKLNLGRELGLIGATRDVIGILIPIIAGFLIGKFNFDVVFIISIILYLISGIPYLTLPKTHEHFSWSYKETWRQFFSKERRDNVLAFLADGAEEEVGYLVWPLFIFQLLRGNFLQVGAISTIIIGVAVVLEIVVGRKIDFKTPKEHILKAGTILYSIGWVFKIFVATGFHIFIAGAYHSTVRILLRTPFDALTYEIAADQGHYVDEFTVLHEMAIQAGKILACIAIIAVSFFLPIQWTFILAAFAALFLNLLRTRRGVTTR